MPDTPLAPSHSRTIKVWDLPTRLFHWSLAAVVVALLVTGFTGKLSLHMQLGQLALALGLFRIIWGFAGNTHARFRSFIASPARALGYLRGLFSGSSQRYLGHNPLGAYAVLALIGLTLLQAGSGLFTSDDIATDGPLYSLVASGTSAKLSTLHRLNAEILLGVIGLHLLANLFYALVKKENLVQPMITGSKQEDLENSSMATGATTEGAGNLVALIVFALCVGVVFGGVRLLGG